MTPPPPTGVNPAPRGHSGKQVASGHQCKTLAAAMTRLSTRFREMARLTSVNNQLVIGCLEAAGNNGWDFEDGDG
uniref:Transposase n=1 Tax=Panagrellus redivivus TaxID=6233 RepID=A0A7E4ZXC8_PANRE